MDFVSFSKLYASTRYKAHLKKLHVSTNGVRVPLSKITKNFSLHHTQKVVIWNIQ